MNEVVNCNNCGSTLKKGSSFCGSCGTTVQENKPSIQSNSSPSETQNKSDSPPPPNTSGMRTISRIGVMSVATISLIFGTVIGMLTGVFYFILVLISDGGLIGAFLAWIVSAVGYGLISFLGAILYAWVYNVVAKRVGGIKIELS